MEERERKYYLKIYEIAAAVNSKGSPESILATLVESVTQALEAKGCALMLLSPDRKALVHRAAYGLSDEYINKGPVSADRSIAEALQGKTVAVLNASVDQRIQYREEAEREGVASVLSVPMMLREDIIGVIRVYTADRRHFTTDDIHFVGAVANLGAIALENATLLEAAQKDRDQTSRELLQWQAAMGVWPPRLGGRR